MIGEDYTDRYSLVYSQTKHSKRVKSMITDEMLDNWFTYHTPTPEDQAKYVAIRQGARIFAEIIRNSTPQSADQSAAIRLLREAVMTANASIACNGK